MDPFFYQVMLVSAIAGASTSLLGVYIVGMQMPFIGMCVSHAAMAGAVFANVLKIGNPMIGAVLVATIASISLAAISREKTRLDRNLALAIIFSFMLGVTFLGVGLVKGSRSQILGLLWGSILFVSKTTALFVAIMAFVLVVFAFIFNKELKALLFSRTIAAATGMHAGFVYCLFLALCGVTLSVNLKLIGGLMIYSLITIPAATAYQLCRGHKSVIICATFIGMFSSVTGFLVSFKLDLPTGACIVVVTSLVFAAAAFYRKLRGMED